MVFQRALQYKDASKLEKSEIEWGMSPSGLQ